MFAARFFPASFFAPRYFPETGLDSTSTGTIAIRVEDGYGTNVLINIL